MQTWTFGPSGIYTATWDGVSKVTVTLTAGGQFIASFFAQSLSAAVASPEYQAILSPAPTAPLALSMVASTGVNGFTLQNGTPNILTWTAPNDGNLHRAQIFSILHVTSAETGGLVQFQFFPFPGSGAHISTLFAAGLGTDVVGQFGATFFVPIAPGTTVTVNQGSALTVGAATMWAEIWGS